ncbi:MAG: class I SAM-dependent methyltransferase [Alphaproteobacteria bacterium]
MAEAEERHWWYPATRALLSEAFAPRVAPGARVLDAGCGTGSAGGWLAEGHRVVGLDPEPLALGLYRERRPDVRLVRGGIESLPFADESFDAVLVVTVLYHEAVADPAVALASLARVLRPGGMACVLEPGMPSLRRGHDRVTRTARRFTVRGLRDLVAGAGLEPLRATGAYTFLVPPAFAKALVERGRSKSDLEGDGGVAGRMLSRVAALERRVLASRDLPTGLSVQVVARKPA